MFCEELLLCLLEEVFRFDLFDESCVVYETISKLWFFSFKVWTVAENLSCADLPLPLMLLFLPVLEIETLVRSIQVREWLCDFEFWP